MCALYGSEAEPIKIFGTGELLNTFYSTMNRLAPAVWQLNKSFVDMWDPSATSYDWTLPDNFHVHVKVMRNVEETVHFLNTPYKVIKKVNAPNKMGRSIGANVTHSVDGFVVREMARRCMYDPETVRTAKYLLENHGETQPTIFTADGKQSAMVETLWEHYENSGFLSARILDHLNIVNIKMVAKDVVLDLINSLPAKPFELVSVHDCWRCLPAYGNDLRKQYNLQLSLIAKSKMLGYLVGQLLKEAVPSPKMDASMAEEILQANYSLS